MLHAFFLNAVITNIILECTQKTWGCCLVMRLNRPCSNSLFCLVNFVKSYLSSVYVASRCCWEIIAILCLLLMPKLKAWSSNPNISFQHLPYEEFQVCLWQLIPSKTVVKICHLQHGFCFGFCASSKNRLIVFQETE